MAKIKLYGLPGTGSAIAEAFLALSGVAYELIEVDYTKPSPLRFELTQLNPIGQIPTLLLPDGSVLTETLAMAHVLNKDNLIPEAGSARFRFLRWSTFIVTAIYPTFNYGDDPSQWVENELGQKELRASTDEWRQKLWQQLDREAGAPYFLGNDFSAIDIYIKVMSHWRPGPKWFEQNCPQLTSIAARVSDDPRLQAVWESNF